MLRDDQTPFIPSALTCVLAEKPLKVLYAYFPCPRLMHDSDDNQGRVPGIGVQLEHLGPSGLNSSMERSEAGDCDVAQIVFEISANGFKVGPLTLGIYATGGEAFECDERALKKS